jgi:hypothetical protein
VASELRFRSEVAQQSFNSMLAELRAFANLESAAVSFRDTILRSSSPALHRLEEESARLREREEILRQNVEAEAARLQEREEKLQQALARQREELEEFRKEFDSRLKDLGGRTSAEPATAPAAEVLEGFAWEATKSAHADLRGRGIPVKLPELSDEVIKHVPGLSPERFRELLQRWQDADRLVLQRCSDPTVEPRATEGIRSTRGLLFYVQML